MATQGMLVICTKRGVQIKMVVGCNGYQIDELVKHLMENKLSSPHEVFEAAKEFHFGCENCRVLLYRYKKGIEVMKDTDEEIKPLYFQTFYDSFFNPRWQSGYIEHRFVIRISRKEGEIVFERSY